MGTQGRIPTNRNYKNVSNQNVTYLYGSTAQKMEAAPNRLPQRQPQRHNVPNTHPKTRVKAKPSPVNVPLLILTLFTFAISAVLMIKYISLNSEITALTHEIQKIESQVNALKAENDEYHSRIISSVDLEKVREVAIMDLGMVYASEGQIITYDTQIDDYVEQSRVIKD